MGFLWKHLDIFTALGVLALSAALYIFSFVTHVPETSGFLGGLSASLIGSLFVIFGIDALRLKRIDTLKAESKEAARRDLQRIANISISYLLCPLRIVDLHATPLSAKLGGEWSFKANYAVLDTIHHAAIEEAVRKLTPDQLRNLKINFSLLSSEFRDVFTLYRGLIPHDLQGTVFSLRQAFNQVTLIFSVCESVLFREGIDHSVYQARIVEDISEYSEKIKEFTNVLAAWK